MAMLLCAPSRSLAAGVSLCGAGLQDFHFLDGCFPPKHILRVEARMATRPIRPAQIVERVANPPLTELRLRNVARPIEIDYLFGRVPVGPGALRLADLGSKHYHYVLVGEQLFQLPPSVKQVYSVPTYVNTKQAVGYWVFEANFRCGPLALTVISNGPKRWVIDVGRQVLKAQVCGK